MKYLILSLFMGLFNTLFSQGSIKGVITDKNDEPIFGAQIYIELLHIGTTSDESGFFELDNIPNGHHSIVIQYIGFNTESVSLDIHDSAHEISVHITESVFHMDEIIVSTPFHKIQSENVIKVEHKSIKTMEKSGVPTLVQGIVSIPGVEQISAGTGIGKPVIRGLSGNRVLIYAQGVRLENQQFGEEHGLGLNGAGIESVEVIKGPASLLYGSDALGGVLYFNPERFALNNETKVNVSQNFFSNTLGSNTSVGVKTSTENFKFLLRGTLLTHIDYKIPDGNRVTNTRFNEKDFKAGFEYGSDNFITELRYNYNKSNIGLTEGINLQSTERTPDHPYQDISNHILSLHNHLFFKNSKLDFNLGYVNNHRQEYEDEHDHLEDESDHLEDESDSSDPASLDMILSTFTYDVKYNFPKLKHFESIVGIQGLRQQNKNYGHEILIPNSMTNDFGVLYSGLITWNEHNVIQLGLRLDYRNITTEEYDEHSEDEEHIFEALDKTYNNYTASLGYKTDISEKLRMRINMASGYRAPNLAELTSHGVHHGSNRFEIGNPDLESEQNIQFDISLEYHSEHFEFFANGFYNNIFDFIFLTPTGEIINDYEVFTYVQNDAALYGGELGLHIHPHPLDWLHLESSFESVTGKQKGGDYLPLIPTNKLSNILRGEFRGNDKFSELHASVEFQNYFAKNDVNSFEEASKAYNLLHIGLGANLNFKKSSLKINFNINNVLNKEYISHLSILKADDIPNIGRNIMIGFNYNI